MTNYDFGRGDQENIKKLQARNNTPVVLKDELNTSRFEKEEVTNP